MIWLMEIVSIHHPIPPYPLMLVAKPGKIQFVNNVLLIGYLMQTMFVSQFIPNVKLTRVKLALAAIQDMI